MTGPERHEAEQDMGGLAGLGGMEAVREQLASAIAVIRAEQARRDAGRMVARPAWKNLVFTGGPGSGKSRAAAAVGRLYRQLGVLPAGHLTEVASADLAGATSQQTGQLVAEAASRGRGGILMITSAHAWAGLADRDHQVLRCLQQALTDFRGDLVVILAGQASGLRALLRARPALAARFPVIINFPGYTAGHLAAIFATLAGEAGFTLTPAAVRKASVTLGRAGRDPADGSARLAVWLLDQATARQARRITTALSPWNQLRRARSAPRTSPTRCISVTCPGSHAPTTTPGQVSTCSCLAEPPAAIADNAWESPPPAPGVLP